MQRAGSTGSLHRHAALGEAPGLRLARLPRRCRLTSRRVRPSDDYFFGVLHSRVHEVWARRRGRSCASANPGSATPPPPASRRSPSPGRPVASLLRATSHGPATSPIAAAAKELDALRTAWLNPPEWTRDEVLEFPGSVDGPWARFVHDPDGRGIGTVRWPRLVPRDAECAAKLKARTLTNLYNQRPTWLDLAHETLDAAVFAAYGWDPAIFGLLAIPMSLGAPRTMKVGGTF